MNQKQLSLFIRHAFSLTNAESAAVKGADPAFAGAMTQIKRLVETLPEQALLQEQAWKKLKPQVMQALVPYNESFRQSIVDSLGEIAPEIEENVIKSLEAVDAPLPIGTTGPIRNAPAGQLQGFGNQILANNVQAALRKTSIANVKLEKLFQVDPTRDTPTSLWMKQNYGAIDRTVRTGILQGASTQNIAAQISEEISKSGLLKATKDTATGKIKAQANTVAITAVQSFNRQITEQVWDANEDALEGLLYEWTSALDSRVCPTCGPLDGQKRPKRGELPSTPIHPRCRCNVVLVDPDDDDDVRTAIELSETKPTGKGAYATPVRVNGKEFYRKAVEIKPKGATYADYLADMAKKDTKNARVTLTEFFGGGGKKGQGESTLGTERANWFIDATKKGMQPDKALQRLIIKPELTPVRGQGKRLTKAASFRSTWNRDIDPPQSPGPKRKPKPKGPSPTQIAKEKAAKAAKAKAAAQAKAAAKANAEAEAKAKQVAAAKAKAEAEAKAKAQAAAKAKAKAEAAAKAKHRAEQAAIKKAKEEVKRAKAALAAEKAKQKAAAEARAAELAKQKAKAEAAAKAAAEAKAKADALAKKKAKPKPKAESVKSTDPKAFIQQHQWDNGKNSLSHKAIADSLEATAQAPGLSGQHMREMMDFQQKKKIQTMWSNGREKQFNAKGDDFAHWKNPEVIESMRQGTGKGEVIVRGLADELEKGKNGAFIKSIGHVSGGAAGHTVEAAHLIVMKQESQFVELTQAGVERLRAAVKNSVKQSASGSPLQITTKDLYKRTGKTTQKTTEGWLGTYIHEMGHQVHFRAGSPSLKKLIQPELEGLKGPDLFNKAWGLMWKPSSYGTTNEFERFAETFVQYVLAPDELKKASPLAYKWVQEAMKAAMK